MHGRSLALPRGDLVEGLFDYAALRQVGFHNVTCSLGTHPTTASSASLRRSPHRHLTFDVDANQKRTQAAEQLAAIVLALRYRRSAASCCHGARIPTLSSFRRRRARVPVFVEAAQP